MTKSEQFAIDEWLYDYPKTATFDDILYLLLDDNDTTIVCYPQGESMSKRDLANCISGTQTHFAFVVGEWTMKNSILDVLTAFLVGLALCVGLLAYFDILVK